MPRRVDDKQTIMRELSSTSPLQAVARAAAAAPASFPRQGIRDVVQKMKRPLAIAALLVLAPALGFASPEAPKGIPDSAVVRDEKEASRRAEAFFLEQASGWEKQTPSFRAESALFARSPARAAGLERGDPLWIVVVVNDAESTIFQTPVGIIWVRATDGAIFETEPKRVNQTP